MYNLLPTNLMTDPNFFKTECESQLNNDIIKEIESVVSIEKLYSPAFYKDQSNHEKAKSLIEELGYKCETLALGFKKFGITSYRDECISTLIDWCSRNKGYKKSFMGDTQLVICSRLSHLVFAANILKEDMTTDELIIVSQWVNNVYIKAAKYLTKSFFHKTSNHGAWGLMGLAAAHDFLGDTVKDPQLIKILHSTEKHLKRATKQPFWTRIFGKYTSGKKEFWVENMRTLSGVYYTYYHCAPTLKLIEILSNNEIDASSIENVIKPIVAQLFKYATEEETWPYMEQSKIFGIKHLQQLIFPSGKEFRPLYPNSKSAIMFDVYDYMYSTDNHQSWILHDDILNVDGPWRHHKIQFELGTIHKV